ncbi:MAG: DNA gyrase/topoisomerase IV subunit A [Salinivirgaceae bacterium]|nr:DNA gyrase/topoisomerase IV subunit A [Salinivirgaceae bacterium]
MSDELNEQLDENLNELDSSASQDEQPQPTEHYDMLRIDSISGMYKNWFLDYASYVILERAVPYLEDGLKPVQRRVLHTMKKLDDGRFNKVANVVGATMQFHPHGDAGIYDALVGLGQKELLIDTQGNWGNIFTGDGAAAGRYIEARLSKFAQDVVFSPKITQWQLSYDGRNQEPVRLPIKFPLLLAQGVEGIAVGLASKILPHNFIELCDASISCLKNEPFELYPDFPTGGLVDVSRYNDGLRGGAVRVRVRIDKSADNKVLTIHDVPYGKSSGDLIETILKANDKGKIKIKHVDDNTASEVEIKIYLQAGVSPDKTIDALYAFTDCELSISPNACVIENDKPRFMGVSEMLRFSTAHTMELLRQELLVRLDELETDWNFSSLERIFIEERIYKDKEYENGENYEVVIKHIRKRLKPYEEKFIRPVTDDDIRKLFEIRMRRILKFSSDEADAHLRDLEEEMAEVKNHLEHLVDYTINHFRQIKKKYGAGRERKTEIRNFENIEVTKVAEANAKLYANFEEGFIGTGLKKDQYVCDCSDLDDIIVFHQDGKYSVVKVSEKQFVGKDIIHVAVFRKNDERTIYNVVYRDGKIGSAYMKRFSVTGVTREKTYDVTQGREGSKILYFSANPNGEAETIKVYLKPKPGLKKLVYELDFSTLLIKGRQSQGNVLARNQVHRIVMKEAGVSTLGGLKIWFDDVVNRLNTSEHGRYLGEFKGNDKILVITTDGNYQLTSFDLTNHYPENVLRIEKYVPHTIYSAVFYYDTVNDKKEKQRMYYLKRFEVEDTNKVVNFMLDDEQCTLVLVSTHTYPQLQINFGGKHKDRPAEMVDVSEFIAVKGVKAKGKRLTTFEVKSIVEVDPIKDDEPILPDDPTSDPEDDGGEGPDLPDGSDIPIVLPNGPGEQMSLF